MESNGETSREAQRRRAVMGMDSLTLWDKATSEEYIWNEILGCGWLSGFIYGFGNLYPSCIKFPLPSVAPEKCQLVS